MRRRLGRLGLLALTLALLFFGCYALWLGWQREVTLALYSGEAQPVMVWGRQMLLTELRMVVGATAVFFSLLTLVLSGLIFWLTQAGDHDKDETH